MDFKTRYQYNPKTDLLGKGGFATVYKAHDALLNRTVALKFFTGTNDKHTLIAEISRAISLEHPNLCRYYDAALQETSNFHGEIEKMEIGVMEYLDGGDLKSYCKTHPDQIIKLLIDVLNGLAYLHENGIIHRDLKPANVLIKNTPKGPVAKITDFGISKETGSGNTSSSQLMGTIEYMAPEQFSPQKYGINGKIGTNLDLWSFGLMVYELVTGESLFGTRGGQSSAEQVMSNILNDELIDDKIKRLQEPYQTLVSKCLVKDARQRVQSSEELIGLLQGVPVFVNTFSGAETKEISFVSHAGETVKMPNSSEEKPGAVNVPEINYLKFSALDMVIGIITLIICCICCIYSYLGLTDAGRLNNIIYPIFVIAGSAGFGFLSAKKQVAWLIKRKKHVQPAGLLKGYVLAYLAIVIPFYGILLSHVYGVLHYLLLFYLFSCILFIVSIVYLIVIISAKQLSPKIYLSGFTKAAFIFFNIFLTAIIFIFVIDLVINPHREKVQAVRDRLTSSDTTRKDSVAERDTLAVRKTGISGTPFVLNDSFDDNHNNWPLADDTVGKITIQNSKLVIKHLSDNVISSTSLISNTDVNKDFSCSVTEKWKSGTTDYGFGIRITGGDSPDYRFELSANNQYCMFCFQNNKETDIVDWTNSKYIHGKRLNALLVKKTGDRLKFYINGHMVKSVQADGHYGNIFGVVVEDAQTVEFDDFKLEGTNK